VHLLNNNGYNGRRLTKDNHSLHQVDEDSRQVVWVAHLLVWAVHHLEWAVPVWAVLEWVGLLPPGWGVLLAVWDVLPWIHECNKTPEVNRWGLRWILDMVILTEDQVKAHRSLNTAVIYLKSTHCSKTVEPNNNHQGVESSHCLVLVYQMLCEHCAHLEPLDSDDTKWPIRSLENRFDLGSFPLRTYVFLHDPFLSGV
jgi:hypothetical protein